MLGFWDLVGVLVSICLAFAALIVCIGIPIEGKKNANVGSCAFLNSLQQKILASVM